MSAETLGIFLSEICQDTEVKPRNHKMTLTTKGNSDQKLIQITLKSKTCLLLQFNITIIDDDLYSAIWLKYICRVNMWRLIIAIMKLQFHILVVP